MKINRSPWLHELNKERPVNFVCNDLKTDVAIIGAGIAGISTAFFILKNTKHHIALVEKNKLAHGATGHNAGQVVTYFERSTKDLIKEFGVRDTVNAQKAIEDSWELLSEMYTEAHLNIPFSRFVGYTGYCTLEQVLDSLEESRIRHQNGLSPYDTCVSESASFLNDIPKEYEQYYKIVPHKEILSLLETENGDYIATEACNKGTINSALLCQEVYEFLKEKYKDRFTLYEGANVKKIVLHEQDAILDLENCEISTKKVILCTNGFENLSIYSHGGMKLDTSFHSLVTGVVARMSGYLEKMNKSPAAFTYYVKDKDGFDNMDEAYFYLTRRLYEYEPNQKHNLICIGGPQHSIADREEYLYEYEYPDLVPKEIDKFIRENYDTDPNKKINYQFTWHGLMGYTPNKVRLIGEEPSNNVLLYNLGCNGIGILPSIFGGKRIADILGGKKVEPMIFDPKNQKL